MHVHKLGERCHHHPRQCPAHARDLLAALAQQVVFQLAKGHVGDCVERFEVYVVVNAHNRVDLPAIVDERTIVEMPECETGENRTCGLTLDLAVCRKAGQPVARLRDVGGTE
jgi:hypothetical protein